MRRGMISDKQMKQNYQERVCAIANDPNGMITVDGSDFGKKGTKSAGVWCKYCGSKGKVENCQAGVFIGYSGIGGYGLLDARLYLPGLWFDAQGLLVFIWHSGNNRISHQAAACA